MKTLQLKAVHRFLLTNYFNEEGSAGGYPMSDIGKMYKILEKLSFNDEERTLLNIRTEADKVMWDSKDNEGNEIDVDKPIELSDEEAELMKRILKKKDEAKKFTLVDLNPVMEVASQLELTLS